MTRTSFTLEASSIYELVSADVDRWQPQSQARRVELSLEASADLPDMDIDRMRMSQALGNVLSNSLLCTQAGGKILLRAGLEGDEALAISITDNGIGIHAADLPHVFDRFYRTDQSRSRGIGDTGLGLAITRAIVQAHGGTVTVRSDGLGLTGAHNATSHRKVRSTVHSGPLGKDRTDPSGLLRVASHIWKTSPPTIRVGLLPGHDASASLRPDASHYRN